MTIEQTKASITAQLNQQAVTTLVNNLAEVSVANEELKAKIVELESKVAALTQVEPAATQAPIA